MDRRSFHSFHKMLGLGALSALAGDAVAQRGAAHSNHPQPAPIDFSDHAGFQEIFDGKTLADWDGNPQVWSVEDGAIVGVSTLQKPSGNTFLVYHGTQAKNFDLKLEIKVEHGGGSGMQYRSSTGLPPPSSSPHQPRPGAPQPPPPDPRP